METLRRYYEDELTFIRQMGSEFGTHYPKIAGRLKLDGHESADPHVERLLEGFALLAGRVQHKLDEEFPEFTESLLDLLYPHFLRPIPSRGIVQFALGEGQSKPERIAIPRATTLHSRPADGSVCIFRTCYPIEIWPIRTGAVSSVPASTAGLTAAADVSTVIRVVLESRSGLAFRQLPLSRLSFYLGGTVGNAGLLYELLCANLLRIIIRSASAEVVLPSECLQPIGFSNDEAVLPYSDRSFSGYRLLQEYFSFPEKFLFVELSGLEAISKLEAGPAIELLFCIGEIDRPEYLSKLALGLDRESFLLGCTPVVNLFERDAEPIRLSHKKFEYRIVPDQHRQLATEVHTVNRVSSSVPYGEQADVYEPLYRSHPGEDDGHGRRFWFARRRQSTRRGDKGNDVYLSLVNLDLEPALPATEILSVNVTCTNRDRAEKLPWTMEWGDLGAENHALTQTRFVQRPKPAVRPPLSGNLHWRLISHLSLNHLSIASGGREALQEILRLYDFSAGKDSSIEKQIAGIVGVGSRQAVSRVLFDSGVAFCRGLDIEIEFDEEQYTGTSVLLFASVLERFFGLYSTINSFSRLTARSRQRKGVLKRWTALAGEQRIL